RAELEEAAVFTDCRGRTHVQLVRAGHRQMQLVILWLELKQALTRAAIGGVISQPMVDVEQQMQRIGVRGVRGAVLLEDVPGLAEAALIDQLLRLTEHVLLLPLELAETGGSPSKPFALFSSPAFL